ncbi:hypothetical protein BGZ65_005892 [Modicella reniformis]|uniref:Uncharacterized protein n=1 Tax=Modicella reniformis TaxID=1440133 RepID=A0A9P6IXC2_9FUNG|nr:hypothetical protein BGZ65_005892 [Modicella reniformis]
MDSGDATEQDAASRETSSDIGYTIADASTQTIGRVITQDVSTQTLSSLESDLSGDTNKPAAYVGCISLPVLQRNVLLGMGMEKLVPLEGQFHLTGGIKPTLDINPSRDFMLYLCAESLRICEQCFSGCVRNPCNNDAYQIALPVSVWRIKMATRTTMSLPLSWGRARKHWAVRLCFTCRSKVFKRCPESMPREMLKSYLGYNAIIGKYALEDQEIKTITRRSLDLFSQKEAKKKARSKFGGDVGIAAAIGSMACDKTTMMTRLEDVCLRLTITAVDG